MSPVFLADFGNALRRWCGWVITFGLFFPLWFAAGPSHAAPVVFVASLAESNPNLNAAVHPEGFSGLHLTISGDQMRAVITLHTRDLGAWFPPRKYPDYVADVTREMETTVDEILELQVDGQTLPVTGVKAFLLETGLIEIDLDFQLPAATKNLELLVWSKHLIQMPRGHQQLLFVEDRRELAEGAKHGVMRLEDVLTVERDAAAVLLPPVHLSESPQTGPAEDPILRGGGLPVDPGYRSSRISFFRFGVEHIVTGYDHLLFLAALLLVCKTFREAATIITCFTIAHSITLALAALDFVRLPAGVVEPTIAATIVFVGIENLSTNPPLWRRAAITCLFGLVHGLGFASALRDIGLGTIPGGVAWPLLNFNLGVEAGQLAVAALILPLLLWARQDQRLIKWLVPTGSVLVVLVGGYWLVTRVVSQFMLG